MTTKSSQSLVSEALKVVKTIDKKHDKITIEKLPNTSVNNKSK